MSIPDPSKRKSIESGGEVFASHSPEPSSVAESRSEPLPKNPLTPEEQMALYEKDLKENDWGHQPC